MGKVGIIIDWIDHNYGAAPLNDDIACVSTGKTLDEVKANILSGLAFHRDGMIDDGVELPEELVGELIPEFQLTTRAQLKYADKFITRKALARETGIAEQQLSHYANGQRHPRPSMQRRITEGIASICRQLSLVL